MSSPPVVPIRRLWIAILCGYLALGATLQHLPAYLVQRFDAGPVVVGTVISAAFLATAIARPYAGRSGDLGASRGVATSGAVIVALAAVAHPFAPTIAVLILARLAMGVGEALLFSATLPWVLGSTPEGRRGSVAGWFGLSMWSGLSVGPLIAGLTENLGGDRAVWATVAALPLVSLLLLVSTRSSRAKTPWRGILGVHPRVLLPQGGARPALCLGLSAYGYGTVTALLILYLTTHRLGGAGWALSLYAAAFLGARTIGSPMVDRWGGRRMAAATVLIQGAGLTIVAVESTTAMILMGVVVTGIGVGSIYPATSAMTLARAEDAQAGTAMGSMTSLWDLGIMFAGPVGGVVAATLGYRAAFAVAVVAAITAFGIAARAKRPNLIRHRSPTRTAVP
ncbi:MFS transporter [Williamsia sp. SKLECPSW1]